MPRTILITRRRFRPSAKGARSNSLAEVHQIIAAAHTWPLVTALRAKVKALALPTLRVEKLDLLDAFDVARARG